MANLHQLAYSLEDVNDTVIRLGHLTLQHAVVRTGVDLKLYDLLCASKSPLSVDEIAKATGAKPQLTGRLLRFLASVDVIKETSKDTFTSNNVTKNLTIPGSPGGICHSFETVAPQYHALPTYLKKVNYESPTDPEHTVFQDAFNFEGPAFKWFEDHPENLAYFQEYMSGRRQTIAQTWLSVYPVEAETKGVDPSAPLFVDIGGSIGHICAQFKEIHPNIPGRVILQDLPENIAAALLTPGVEVTAHDFFKPQPIKDAKYYYLAHVLHDWSDRPSRDILGHTKAAMGKDSVILIDEMVLPDTGVHSNVTSIDLEMMCAMASAERTQSQWDELFASVGLKRVETRLYGANYESVMKVVIA